MQIVNFSIFFFDKLYRLFEKRKKINLYNETLSFFTQNTILFKILAIFDTIT